MRPLDAPEPSGFESSENGPVELQRASSHRTAARVTAKESGQANS